MFVVQFGGAVFGSGPLVYQYYSRAARSLKAITPALPFLVHF
jgi:hypothetical protein